MKTDDFKKSEYYQSMLENFEIIYREAFRDGYIVGKSEGLSMGGKITDGQVYDEGWNDALAKVQTLLPKQEDNGK